MSCLVSWLYVAVARKVPQRQCPATTSTIGDERMTDEALAQLCAGDDDYHQQFDAHYCLVVHEALKSRPPPRGDSDTWNHISTQLHSLSECDGATAQSAMIARRSVRDLHFTMSTTELLEHARSVTNLFVPTVERLYVPEYR